MSESREIALAAEQRLPMLFYASARANGGHSVFPCKKKKPLVEGGGGFKGATRNLKQIMEWWTEWPDAQIGVPTGSVNRLVVLDIDGEEGAAWLSTKLLPETRIVETRPGRRQYWFQLPEGRVVKSSQGQLAPEVDVRGEGGYVIAPPSIHHLSHKPYRFANELPLAIAPDWLLAPPPRKPIPHETETGIISEGAGRHREILRIAGWLRRQGLSEETILEVLRPINGARCSPPLEMRELRRLTRYIGTKPPGEGQ
jgi:hypothetical protein